MITRRFYVVCVLAVLALAGTACKEIPADKARIVFIREASEIAYFQPEDSTGFCLLTTDSLGKAVRQIHLETSAYYRYVDGKTRYYSVYLVPGTSVKIAENAEGVSFEGDYAAENKFMAENSFTGHTGEGVGLYTADWQRAIRQEVDELITKLGASRLNPGFIRQQTWNYKFMYYKQLLGVSTMQMFLNASVELPDHFYDFLKEVSFDDSLILNVPQWFPVMRDAFERMEKEGMLEVSPQNYMQVYAGRITDEKVRSQFLLKLLEFSMQKGYSDDFPLWLMSVRSQITGSAAEMHLSALEAAYQEQKSVNREIMRGEPAPDFKVVDIKGKTYSLADFRGKIVVLDFWFTGCVPCRAEMPYLEKMADEMKGLPIAFVSMSLDSGEELLTLWEGMVKDKKGAALNLNVPGGFKSDLAKAYKIHSVPQMVILDKEGRIIDACAKRPSDPKLRIQLEQLIKS